MATSSQRVVGYLRQGARRFSGVKHSVVSMMGLSPGSWCLLVGCVLCVCRSVRANLYMHNEDILLSVSDLTLFKKFSNLE